MIDEEEIIFIMEKPPLYFDKSKNLIDETMKKVIKELPMWNYILDENKNIIPTKDLELIENFIVSPHRIVRQNIVRNYYISTVFLSIDHDWSFIRGIEGKPNPNPLLFETMINHEGVWTDYQVRYKTYKEALIGHRCAVRSVIKTIRE